MKITIKTLQQKSFTVEIDEDETVSALKQKISDDQGAGYPVEGLKLIYSGKILVDGNKISEYNIQPTNFVVVMVSKGKGSQSKPQAATKAPNTSETTSTGSIPSQPTTTEVKPQQESTTSGGSSVPVPRTEETDSGTTSASASHVNTASETLVTGSEYEVSVTRLMEMGGFTRDQVVRAMTHSYNNPDRAAEYLFEGKADEDIPPITPPDSSRVQPGNPVPMETGSMPGGSGSSTGDSSGGGGQPPPDGANPLVFLQQLPQFQQFRQQIRANPSMLPMILQHIGQTNPELLQLITQNQDQFISLLNEPDAGGSGGNIGGVPMPQGGSPGGNMGGGQAPPPGTMHIQVTQEEKAAIDRLKSLGFPEHMVLQAYFACDKNEELAANFLLQEGNDD